MCFSFSQSRRILLSSGLPGADSLSRGHLQHFTGRVAAVVLRTLSRRILLRPRHGGVRAQRVPAWICLPDRHGCRCDRRRRAWDRCTVSRGNVESKPGRREYQLVLAVRPGQLLSPRLRGSGRVSPRVLLSDGNSSDLCGGHNQLRCGSPAGVSGRTIQPGPWTHRQERMPAVPGWSVLPARIFVPDTMVRACSL